MSLEGRVAVVTGGGQGLGREFAMGLGEAGAAVGVVARAQAQLDEMVARLNDIGVPVAVAKADITDPANVTAAFATIEAQLGSVDVLVNNAGVFKAFGKVSEVDPEQWWYEIEVNLKGQFLCAQAVLPGMIQRRRGRIINLASVGGTGTFPAISAYSTSKAALIHLTASIAAENEEHDVFAFAVHPGTVHTRMLDELSASDELLQRAEYLHTAFNEVMSTKATIAPERVVSLVCALAAGRADRLSGRYISIDDELDDLVARAEEIRTEDLYTLRIRS
jgi:NAD(P)-dependent dehydrogenase (short-subunit alcohol dehydrogenase family)